VRRFSGSRTVKTVVHVADRREWKKLFRGTPSLHRHLARRSPPSSSPDEFRSASSSARACSAQLTQTHCLGGRAAPLPEAPRPRSSVPPSGASRSNGLKLDLSPRSVRISCRLARFLSCISGDTQTRAEAVHPHIPSVATCIVIAYRVQFEHHKPLAGREKWIT